MADLTWKEIHGELHAQASFGGEYIIERWRRNLETPAHFEVVYFNVVVPDSSYQAGTTLHRAGRYLRPSLATLDQAKVRAQTDHDATAISQSECT